MTDEAVTLATSTLGWQANEVGISRPVPVKLSDSDLAETMVPSVGHRVSQMRDTLFVRSFDAGSQRYLFTTYYFIAPNWYRDEGQIENNPIANDDVIPAGVGLVVEKARTSGGDSDVWVNPATYASLEPGSLALRTLGSSQTSFPEQLSNVSSAPPEPGPAPSSPAPNSSSRGIDYVADGGSADGDAVNNRLDNSGGASQPGFLDRHDRKAATRLIQRRSPGDFDLSFDHWSPEAVKMFSLQRFGVELSSEENRLLLRRLTRLGRQGARSRE